MAREIIRIEGLHKTYALDGVEVHALRGIDLILEQGEYLAIMGPSGSGKSTLMNIIGCLDVADEGRYWLNGQDVMQLSSDQLAEIRNRELGFVFQNFNLLARTSALENVETPLIYAGVNKQERRHRSQQMLERVGLGDRLYHLPNQLSGGQQQRVAIARALVTQPSLLLADEPTGNMDTATSAELLVLLDELNQEQGLTIALITHEPDVAARAKRMVILRDGRLESSS
ncbi:MAG: macrolide ABC transporter ATP-binding protein [Gammaproteobacteria bacterium SG8_15]|nr:MAG: macrolide ABC transporter ATP-binding protein [Gammaproteobacteria bacterium SG8_15]